MKKDRTVFNTVAAVLLTCIIVGTWSYFDYQRDYDVAREKQETESKLQKELLLNSSCNHHVDSLNYINGELSKFQTLTLSMVHKKEATKGLRSVGDIAYMKNDSSRVVVEDVLIGGGKYNYYVKYRVIFKNDTVKEISPEMIY
jgi:hypothetical protein